jgi:hypothetical protein
MVSLNRFNAAGTQASDGHAADWPGSGGIRRASTRAVKQRSPHSTPASHSLNLEWSPETNYFCCPLAQSKGALLNAGAGLLRLPDVDGKLMTLRSGRSGVPASATSRGIKKIGDLNVSPQAHRLTVDAGRDERTGKSEESFELKPARQTVPVVLCR